MSIVSPVLSVVIVAYKSRDEIVGCLTSIPVRLRDGPVETIVVDNSSDDQTAHLIKQCLNPAKYFPQLENLGFGRASNLGFQLSTGRNVLFLNPDTICNEQALTLCLERLTQEKDIGLISAKLVLADGKMDLACRRSVPTPWDGFCRASNLADVFPRKKLFAGYNLTYLPEGSTYDVGVINGAFMMGRREVFDKVGLFDETFFMYGDDLDLCIRARKAGYRVVYDGRVQITHLKGLSVAKDYDRMSQAIFDANRDVYLKHFNPRNSVFVKWKYRTAFGLWKAIALWRAKLIGRRVVKPI